MSNGNNPLGRSFMLLSFVTAALLVGVQTRALVAKPADKAALSLIPIPAMEPVASKVSAVQPSSEQLQPGLDQILSASLHPVALIHQPQLVVDLSDRQLILYQEGVMLSRFDIAVGKAGWETPSGSFSIMSMRRDPVWQNPITREIVTNPAENPLGSRWIGFWTDGTHQIGFHGTNETELIGQAVSHGCVRMRDTDVQALFEQVAIGTPVLVQP